MQEQPIKVLMAKPSLDGHWRGIAVVSLALRNAGMEVIHGGYMDPAQIARIAVQEDADVIGLNLSSCNYLKLTEEVMRHLKVEKAENILIIAGGSIASQDFKYLKEQGIAGIFVAGSRLDSIVDFVRENARRKTITH